MKTCNTYTIQKELLSNVLFQELFNNVQCLFFKFNLLSDSSLQSCFPVTEQTQRADFINNSPIISLSFWNTVAYIFLHHTMLGKQSKSTKWCTSNSGVTTKEFPMLVCFISTWSGKALTLFALHYCHTRLHNSSCRRGKHRTGCTKSPGWTI